MSLRCINCKSDADPRCDADRCAHHCDERCDTHCRRSYDDNLNDGGPVSKTATPAEAVTRKGGALTTNPILRGVNRIMKVLGEYSQEDQERAVRMTAELVASQRTGQSDAWRPLPGTTLPAGGFVNQAMPTVAKEKS